jgi:hypothetical protein
MFDQRRSDLKISLASQSKADEENTPAPCSGPTNVWQKS